MSNASEPPFPSLRDRVNGAAPTRRVSGPIIGGRGARLYLSLHALRSRDASLCVELLGSEIDWQKSAARLQESIL